MRESFRSLAGLWRSIGIYYWKPGVRRRLKRFYSAFVQPGMLCFDIGAHLGNRTRAFLDLGAQVIAVEPQPMCIRYLEDKYGHHPGLTIVPKAVAAQRGTARMSVSALYPTISTMAGDEWKTVVQDAVSYPIKWDEEINVETVTLDDLIEAHGLPGFCKIDVEGLEGEVLAGLSQAIPCLSFEFFRESMHTTTACVSRVSGLGTYEFNWSKGESQKLQLRTWTNSQKLLERIEALPASHLSGDIYARLTT